ncbi:MAG: ABC transporter permease [Gemmatimonadota bacterium]
MSITMLLRHAVRSLRRTPVFSVAATLTLVIGIAATVATFMVVNGVLLQPLPYGEPERLVGAWHNLPPINLVHAEQTPTTYYTYQRLAKTIEGIALYQTSAVNVSDPSGSSDPQRVTSAWITATLIPVLKVQPLVGRSFTEAEDAPNGPNVVVISEALWRNRFGASADVLNHSLEINGLTRQVIGVMPGRFRFPEAGTQIWLPLALDPVSEFSGDFSYSSVARLKPGVSAPVAERDFASVLPQLPELYPTFAPGITSQQLLDQVKPAPLIVPLRQDLTGEIARTLWIVAGAAGLVLIVACANVMNLILVRADGRQRELAVREALGAGRGRILAHFFAESAVLTTVASAVGLALAWGAVRVLVGLGPDQIPRLAEVRVDAATVVFTLGVAVLVAVACAIIPALRLGRQTVSQSLREGGRGGIGRTQHRVRGALVVAQIAVALVVLAGSGLLIRTFQHLTAVRPGWNPENVLSAWVALPRAKYATDTSVQRFYANLESRLAQLPGVIEVGLASRLPLHASGRNHSPTYPEGDDSYAKKLPPLQLYSTTSAGYFRAMGIPLIAGRLFDRLDLQRDGEALVSRSTAALFWGDSTGRAAIGKRFRVLPTGPLRTVVGVVGDARDTSLAAPGTRAVYLPQVPGADRILDQIQRRMALTIRTAGDPAAITNAVRRAVHDLDATLPLYDVRPMPAVFRASMAQLTFTIMMLGAAAAVTLLLGTIGLYGVLAYIVTLRTRELGVRIALGAQPSAVAAMMTRQGMVLAGIGIVVGAVAFTGVARFLRTFLFGVAPTDPVTVVAASLLLVAVAMLASWIPARRASRVDPMEALRAD